MKNSLPYKLAIAGLVCMSGICLFLFFSLFNLAEELSDCRSNEKYKGETLQYVKSFIREISGGLSRKELKSVFVEKFPSSKIKETPDSLQAGELIFVYKENRLQSVNFANDF